MNIDLELGGISRPMLRLPEALNLAPTGARLWATWLDRTPGFSGRIDYIHKCNIPSLFTISFAGGTPDYRGHKWYPSRLEVEYSLNGVEVLETKFITWDDVAVSVLEVRGGSPGRLGNATVSSDLDGRSLDLQSGRAAFAVASRGGPGPTGNRVIVAACAVADEPETAHRRVQEWASDPDPASRHQREYASWFAEVPTFHCSDPWINKMWAYRWFLLRRNLADPCRDNLRQSLFYEGRGLKMSDHPFNPGGWEFSKLITFGTPFHLLESRWHPDPAPGRGEVLNLARHIGDDGLLPSLFAHGTSQILIHFIPWAAWQLHLVHPDWAWLREIAPPLAADLLSLLKDYDSDTDFLPEIDLHSIIGTGKEFQPSFWWTPDGFETDPREPPNPKLERVDAACYLHMNAAALSLIYGCLQDVEQSETFREIAGRIHSAVLTRMWDQDLRFFRDLTPDHTRVPVMSVVGFDPFMAGIAGEEHLGIFEHLSNPREFASAYPLPSVSMDCPLFAADARFAGEHIKGEHGCVWNGPTWPFTNSTVLMSLAEVSRRFGHRHDHLFADLLGRYTRLMYRDGDIALPDVVEHYNPLTGAPISQEEDYFHSSWIDLVVTGLAGLQVGEGTAAVDPIPCGLDYFDLDGVVVRGRRIRIAWRDLRAGPDDLEPGLSVWVDGRLAARSESPARVELGLPASE